MGGQQNRHEPLQARKCITDASLWCRKNYYIIHFSIYKVHLTGGRKIRYHYTVAPKWFLILLSIMGESEYHMYCRTFTLTFIKSNCLQLVLSELKLAIKMI
jgi:hypothetical protein